MKPSNEFIIAALRASVSSETYGYGHGHWNRGVLGIQVHRHWDEDRHWDWQHHHFHPLVSFGRAT